MRVAEAAAARDAVVGPIIIAVRAIKRKGLGLQKDTACGVKGVAARQTGGGEATDDGCAEEA